MLYFEQWNITDIGYIPVTRHQDCDQVPGLSGRHDLKWMAHCVKFGLDITSTVYHFWQIFIILEWIISELPVSSGLGFPKHLSVSNMAPLTVVPLSTVTLITLNLCDESVSPINYTTLHPKYHIITTRCLIQ